jgi:hypothetical protein
VVPARLYDLGEVRRTNMRALILCLALATGCAAQIADPPSAEEQEHAFKMVWDGIYNASQYPRPVVHFDKPNCTDDYGNLGIRPPSGGPCLLGWNGQHEIHIYWTGDWSTSAFAHELFHAYIVDTTAPWLQSVVAGDPQHKDPRWYSIVHEQAGAWGSADLFN